MTSDSSITCPLCNESTKKTICNKKGIYKCKECGIIFNSSYKPLKYDSTYFNGDYKKQYGKTYLEDFNNIYKLSQERIKRILLFAKRDFTADLKNKTILDIGCAMGFFLKAALDSGFGNVNGIEISDFAADYCKKHRIGVLNDSFEKIDFNTTYYIITAWYFIEHCEDPALVINKIFNILDNGGIFAFSTPSFFGPQFLFNRSDWIESHPIDHRIDLSPLTVKRYLKRIGFRKVIIRAGGIHPERLISQDSFFYNAFNYVYSAISRVISFSDTIEVYAIK